MRLEDMKAELRVRHGSRRGMVRTVDMHDQSAFVEWDDGCCEWVFSVDMLTAEPEPEPRRSVADVAADNLDRAMAAAQLGAQLAGPATIVGHVTLKEYEEMRGERDRLKREKKLLADEVGLLADRLYVAEHNARRGELMEDEMNWYRHELTRLNPKLVEAHERNFNKKDPWR